MARQKKKKRGGFFSFVLMLMILVVGCIFGRVVILIGVDTENGEVASVARPNPVVGVTTKFANL